MNQNKIKVSYIISSLAKQGPVQVLFDIIANIDFNLFDVTVITLKKEGENTIIKSFEDLPINILKLDKKNKFNLFYLYSRISSHIKKQNIDIIHSHCFRSLLLVYLLRRQSKSFFTIHNNLDLQTSVAMNGRIRGYIILYFTRFFINRIYCTIACSSSIANFFKLNYNIQIPFITNGVFYLSDNTEHKNDIRDRLGFNQNQTYFISLGRFSKEKNFKTLVEAFIKTNVSNTKLIILGEGDTLKQIKGISNEKVILPGFKSNVKEYLAACDFYISTSLTEGMPLSVLEAMSHGLPLILSNIPSHKEIFNHAKGKEIGVLFPSNDLTAIENGVKSILKFDYNKLHQNTISVFKESFTSERMSNEYQEFYIKA